MKVRQGMRVRVTDTPDTRMRFLQEPVDLTGRATGSPFGTVFGPAWMVEFDAGARWFAGMVLESEMLFGRAVIPAATEKKQ